MPDFAFGPPRKPKVGKSTTATPHQVNEIDKILGEIDDREISQGRPPLSVTVRHDDGNVGQAFWNTVEKHKLRRPGEKDHEVVERITTEAHNFHGRPKN